MTALILPDRFAHLKPEQRTELVELLDELDKRQTRRQIDTLFPDTGPLRRELYQKHLQFFRAGLTKHERALIAANRVGKTIGFGAEVTWHLTGLYPSWWEGRRWNRPVKVLASGDTHDTTRDIIQLKMLGALSDRPDQIGTGLIPWQYITSWVPRPHVKGAIELCRVKHVSGGESEFYMRSFEQGRVIFQGVELDIFWPDEECPLDVYTEGLMRTMTTHGMTALTFTPLEGRTELVNLLMDPQSEAASDREIIQIGWDDVPHLDEDTKRRMLAKLPPHQRDARTKGIPSLGSGAIYPLSEEEITIRPILIPPYWPRCYGLDVGWNRTAAAFLAHDRDADIAYVYSEHYRAHAEPAVHVSAIHGRGKWIPGAIDPASRGRTQKDGEQLIQNYRDLDLDVTEADNAVEAGIFAVWERLSTGRLKVFNTCINWLNEYRGYHRDAKGKVVKENDHLMDATRYGVMTGLDIARCDPGKYTRPTWHDRLEKLTGQTSAMGT